MKRPDRHLHECSFVKTPEKVLIAVSRLAVGHLIWILNPEHSTD